MKEKVTCARCLGEIKHKYDLVVSPGILKPKALHYRCFHKDDLTNLFRSRYPVNTIRSTVVLILVNIIFLVFMPTVISYGYFGYKEYFLTFLVLLINYQRIVSFVAYEKNLSSYK